MRLISSSLFEMRIIIGINETVHIFDAEAALKNATQGFRREFNNFFTILTS